MAIDMKTVKEIEFNNKQVKKIEDNNGNILWQKKSATTVTITLTNLKYIRLYYRTYDYSSTLYAYLNYLNITGISDNRSTDSFVLLPFSVYRNIKNKVYTTDTSITGQNSFVSDTDYMICYVSNNELYSVGNINSTNNSAIGTTSELSECTTYTYTTIALNPGGSSGALYNNNGYYMSAAYQGIIRNVSSPASGYPAHTNGGIRPTLTAASGTMTIQYTI